MNWNVISWYTRTTNSSVVVCAVKILNANITLYGTIRNVPLRFNLHVDVHDWLCVVKRPFYCCRRRSGKVLEFRLVNPEMSVLPDSWLRLQKRASHLKHECTWSYSQANSVFRCSISTVLKLSLTCSASARHSLMSILVLVDLTLCLVSYNCNECTHVLSIWQHLLSDDWLEDKCEHYQNCCTLYCVPQLQLQ